MELGRVNRVRVWVVYPYHPDKHGLPPTIRGYTISEFTLAISVKLCRFTRG